jgi:hypothetical protein
MRLKRHEHKCWRPTEVKSKKGRGIIYLEAAWACSSHGPRHEMKGTSVSVEEKTIFFAVSDFC